MVRQHRIQYPGAWYHVTHRGAGRQDIYKNDIDRKVFLKQVAETIGRYAVEVHAYCLMTNHYHLLIRTPDGNLATAMRHLNSTYSQRFNRAHETDGPVFKGRYWAQLVGEDDYILSLIRYLHLNPAKAGIESELGTYRWSSLGAYLEMSRPPDWLEMGWIQSRLPSVSEFRRLTDSGLGALGRIPADLDESKLVLGSEEFCDSVISGERACIETKASINSSVTKPDFTTIASAVMAVTGCGEADLLVAKPGRRSVPRLVAMSLAAELTDLTRSDLALLFGFKNYFGVATALQKASDLNQQEEGFSSLRTKAAAILASEPKPKPLQQISTETGT